MLRIPAVLLGDLTLLRPLAMAHIPTIVATSDPADPTLRSRFARERFLFSPIGGPDTASPARELCELGDRIADEHGSRAPLFYGSDATLEFIYRHREAIERSFVVLLNDPSTAQALLYKDAFARIARERGVLVPRTLASAEELDASLADIAEAIVVKPKSKVQYAEVRRELFPPNAKAAVFPSGAALAAHPGYARCKDAIVVQEHIEGTEQDLVSFHGFADENCKLLAWFTGRKIRAFPKATGESSFIELTADQQVAGEGSAVARALGLKGVFKIDLIRERLTGRIFTLEVNARFNLWHHLAAADGVNIPRVAYDYLTSHLVPPPASVHPHHRWLNLYRDFKSYRQRAREDELGFVEWFASLTKRPALFEAFAWNDPMPALGWFAAMVRSTLSKWAPSAS